MAIQEVQKTVKQHAVPQNIMDVEFKLIGDLTMRQFTYLLVFGLIAYIVYISMVGVFKWPITMFFVLFGLALAFVPIQERGMDEWFVNFFKAVYEPTQRVWKKESILPPAFTYQNLAVVKQELITLAPTSSRRKLEEYLEIQQKAQVEDKLDIPEKEYILKVRQAFLPVATAVEVEEEEYGTQEYEAFEPYQPVFEKTPAGEEGKPLTPAPPKPQAREEKAEKKEERKETPQIRKAPTAVPSAPSPAPQPEVRPTPKRPRPKPAAMPQIKTTPIPDTFTFSSMTPDRHIGRRFTSMLPSEGQLILPVRGEKVLATSEELNIQKDIDEKTDQLKQLLEQIKSDKDLGKEVAQKIAQKVEQQPTQAVVEQQTPAATGGEITEAQDVVKRVKEENERLSNEIQKLKKDIEKSEDSESEKSKKRALVEELEKEKDKANTDYTALQKQVFELQRRLKEKQAPPQDTGPKKPTFAKMQPITNEPNIVSGVVKGQDGEGIPGIVLLIKNHKGEAVRALKTNTLGQFSISTSLVNGMYTLEIGSPVEGLGFDIITVEVKGDVLPPIELIGREL